MTESVLQKYNNYKDILQQDNIAVSAAELHGLITGMLCAGLDDKANWQVILYDYTNQGAAWPARANAMAEALFAQSAKALNSDLMDFALLQPDENASLVEHAEALAEWVGGFLAGFGIAGKSQISSKDSKEILEDLAQIVQLGIDEDENEQEQLELLSEIIEHVRICVLSLFADNLLGSQIKPSRALH